MLKSFLIRAAAFLIFIGILAGCYLALNERKEQLAEPGAPVYTYCIETKNDADCFLIKQQGINILIDTGEAGDAAGIAAFLKEKGVEQIQYLILTHPDKDHIGGAVEILDNFQVERVIEPYYPKEKGLLQEVNQKIEEQGIDIIYPTRSRALEVGEIDFIVYPPLEKNYKSDNNYSLAVMVNHGAVNEFFTGDAMEKRVNELMQISFRDVDLLKVPYHGRYIPNVDQLIGACSPAYAVVTSDSADEIVEDACREAGAVMVETLKGTRVFRSDGKNLTLLGEESQHEG